jgi:hypothetical protein
MDDITDFKDSSTNEIYYQLETMCSEMPNGIYSHRWA